MSFVDPTGQPLGDIANNPEAALKPQTTLEALNSFAGRTSPANVAAWVLNDPMQGAAWRQSNTLGSLLGYGDYYAPRYYKPGDPEPDPSFDPFAGLEDKYRPFAKQFTMAHNADDTARIKRGIDKELEDRKLIEDAGISGIAASLAAGVFDPINLVPIGGAGWRVYSTGKAILQGTRIGATAGLVGSTLAEAVLQGTQATRTTDESMFAIGAGTVLGGILGASVGYVTRYRFNRGLGDFDAAAKAFADDVTPKPPGTPDLIEPRQVRMTAAELANKEMVDFGPSSVGAAQVHDAVALGKLKGALGLEKVLGADGRIGELFSNPIVVTQTSPSNKVRRFGAELSDTPFFYDGNALGIASPISVETKVRLHDRQLADALRKIDELFLEYRETASKLRTRVRDAFGAPEGKLTYGQFLEEIGRANRRGDRHDIPQVQKAAEEARRTVFDPLKRRAIETGLLPEDVKTETAESYFTRVYDVPKIIAKRPEFQQILSAWLTETQAGVGQRIERYSAALDRATAAAEKLSRETIPQLKAKAKAERADATKTAKVAERAEFKVTEAEAKLDVAERAATKLSNRLEEMAAKAKDEADIVAMLKEVRKGAPKEPQSLMSFIQSQGGVKEFKGELAAFGINNKSRPGFVRESGMTLDDATLKAWEAGYLHGTERPEINDFLDALGEDFRGNRVYSAKDPTVDAYVEAQMNIAALDERLSAAGIDIDTMSDREIVNRLAALGKRGARVSELTVQARRAGKESDKAADRFERSAVTAEEAKHAAATLKGMADDTANKLRQAKKEFSRAKATIDRATRQIADDRIFGQLDAQEIDDIANQIIDKVIHAPAGRIPYAGIPVQTKRGPMLERTLGIEDVKIEDFLESNAEVVLRRYNHTMATDTELADAFGRPDMVDQVKQINEEYHQLIAAAPNEKARKQLEERRRTDVKMLEAMRDRLRGTYGAPADPNGLFFRLATGAKRANYVSMMGGVVLSSLSDIARPVMAHGLGTVIGDGLIPLVTNLPKLRLAMGEAREMAAIFEGILHSRAFSMSDITDVYGRNTGFERFLANASNSFGPVALISQWNQVNKEFAGALTVSRILRAVEDMTAGKVSKSDAEKLAQAGITKQMARQIADQAEQYGEKSGRLRLAHGDKWDNRAAFDVLSAAVSKEVNSLIVTPGIGDKPLWTSSTIGSLIGQFRSYNFASAQRVLMSGLQQRDLAALNGAVLMTSVGMLIYWLKTVGTEKGPSDDPAEWLIEGVDRAGLMGWLFDVNGIAEKLTRGRVGLKSSITGKEMSRFSSRGAVESIFGPTLGRVEDFASMVGNSFAGELTKGNVRDAARMLPYNNLFYFRSLTDAATDGIAESLGAKGK